MATPISFPSTTTNFSLPLLFAGQAQKEFFVNQSLVVIDALLQSGVADSLTTPPSGPSEGSCYRVTSTAIGDWIGHEDEIAIRIGGAWNFVAPHPGMMVFDQQAESFIHYNLGWQSAAEPAEPSGGTTIDAEARTAIRDLIEALRKVGIFPNTP